MKYDLTCSHKGDLVDPGIRAAYPKTYFAQVNKPGFTLLKNKYNLSEERSVFELYALIIYGFNRMLRFNRNGDFNIPAGNLDFNPNVVKALEGYSQKTLGRQINFSNLDFETFLTEQKYTDRDFIYVDPPYLITASEYNKGWDDKSERRLYALLDSLDSRGINFAVSNVSDYGDRSNSILKSWMAKYQINGVKSNYINYFDNGKKLLNEVLVCNYV